ncbi:hypothetical protein Tco_0423998 [Tanacetum coccineum]
MHHHPYPHQLLHHSPNIVYYHRKAPPSLLLKTSWRSWMRSLDFTRELRIARLEWCTHECWDVERGVGRAMDASDLAPWRGITSTHQVHAQKARRSQSIQSADRREAESDSADHSDPDCCTDTTEGDDSTPGTSHHPKQEHVTALHGHVMNKIRGRCTLPGIMKCKPLKPRATEGVVEVNPKWFERNGLTFSNKQLLDGKKPDQIWPTCTLQAGALPWYVGGYCPTRFHGNIVASKPKTMQKEAIERRTELMDKSHTWRKDKAEKPR